jgi:molybdopterin synthase sulfur carrier subunit
MRIGFFGRIGERIGREVDLDLPAEACSVAELRLHLAQQFSAAAADLASGSLRACVDETIVSDSHILRPGQKVEFFPPLSGG